MDIASQIHNNYFYTGIVWFESQEYSFGGRMQFFAKLIKTRLIYARFVMMNVIDKLYTEEIIDFALRNPIND